MIDDTPGAGDLSGDEDTDIAGDDDDPSGFICNDDGGSTPAKSDILRAYWSQRIVSNEVFLDLAWVRADDTGSANVVFELGQNTTADTPLNAENVPCGLDRTEGDVLVTYDFGGQGFQGIRLWTWDDAGDQWSEMGIAPAWPTPPSTLRSLSHRMAPSPTRSSEAPSWPSVSAR